MKNLNAIHSRKSNYAKSPLIAFIIFLLCCLLSFQSQAQSQNALQIVEQYLNKKAVDHGLAKSDISEVKITDNYTDNHNGLTHVYAQQQLGGIEIVGSNLGLHFQNEHEMLHVSNRFFKKVNQRLGNNTLNIEALQAVRSAAADLDLTIQVPLEMVEMPKDKAQQQLFSKGNISLENIPAKLVYLPLKNGTLQLAWEVQIYTTDAQHYWLCYVDAAKGEILVKHDLVISCNFDHHNHAAGSACNQQEAIPSAKEAFEGLLKTTTAGNFYRVYDQPVETPNHGNRTLVYTNGDPVASPYGWHYDGLLQYLVTKGNNVYAYEDQSGANIGLPAIGGINPLQPLNFDFPLDLNQAPSTYKDAAVTNLFYWNNIIHDIFYHYGFNETSGNFQTDNLGKGGLGNDAVMAEAQDGGGTNNANFLTLPDGAPGRMQMYLWSSNAPADLVHINQSSSYPGGGVSFNAIKAAFGSDIDQTGTSGDLVLVEANVNALEGCNSCGCGTAQGVGLPPNNDVSGKIVLIDRGDCSFIEKVMGAQLGGATGVIIANNIPGDGPIAMGGDETGALIIIPAVMISYEDGQELKDELALGSVEIALKRLDPVPPMKDGDLDNGIIAHEYGHGISTRLTGGPSSTCLSGDEQAGEGWSDFFGLLLTMTPADIADAGNAGRGIGTYVFDQATSGTGIRPARYARDMTVNPYTYADINNAEISVPHGVGFIFCSALWDMTWNLIEAHGYDNDVVHGNGGNNLAIQLVIDGLKLQPCAPTFLESRDAILAADMALTGGENQCLIWEAFAKRGMGASASSGTNARGDEIEAFDLPIVCNSSIELSKTANHNQIENGNIITYTLTAINNGSSTVNGVVITDPIPVGSNYVNGSASHGGQLVGNILRFDAVSLNAGQSLSCTFQVTVNTPTETNLLFSDDMEDGMAPWAPTLGLNMWTLTPGDAHSGNFAWFAADPDNISDQVLTLASGVALPSNAEVRFWHKFDTEAGFDGGVVEFSNDDGTTWYDLGPLMTQNGYNDFIPAANNPIINGFAFGGNSGGWIETVANLSAFANQTVLIRFRFASDVLTPKTGWWVDDVLIAQTPTFVNNTAFFTTSLGQNGQASASTLVLSSESAALTASESAMDQPTIEVKPSNLESGDFNITAYPNPAQDIIHINFEGKIKESAQLRLINVQGQVVFSQNLAPDDNQNRTLNVAQHPAGIYMLQVQDEQNVKTVKIAIERF